MPSLLDALKDREFLKSVYQGLTDAANRGMVAGTLGAPVDMATQAANLGIAGAGYLGHKAGLLSTPPELIESRNVPGSSEWIGQKMQNVGAVSANRNPVAEAGMGLLSPVAFNVAQKAGGLLANVEMRAAENAAKPSTLRMAGQRGVLRYGEGSNLEDAQAFASKVPEIGPGLSAKINQDKGGSVYVTVQKVPLTKAGLPAKNRAPSAVDFKARFADHPSYWGSTISSDPFTQNTIDDALQMLRFKLSRNLADAPVVSRSQFDPATGAGRVEKVRLHENVYKNGGGERWDPVEVAPFTFLKAR